MAKKIRPKGLASKAYFFCIASIQYLHYIQANESCKGQGILFLIWKDFRKLKVEWRKNLKRGKKGDGSGDGGGDGGEGGVHGEGGEQVEK